jgi:hypothetical protein
MAFGYPQPDQPQHYIDYNKQKSVTVMVNFAPDGRMLPIYLRWINIDESEENLKIDGVKSTKDIEGGTSYCCYITKNGWRKQVILNFYVQQHIWTMNI